MRLQSSRSPFACTANLAAYLQQHAVCWCKLHLEQAVGKLGALEGAVEHRSKMYLNVNMNELACKRGHASVPHVTTYPPSKYQK